MTMPDLVILCGGKGSRLKSVISDVPKPMAPVAGHPFLEILLSYFCDLGFENAILSIGHMASVISDHFGDKFRRLNLHYCVDPEPLGTGGAARAAAKLCKTETVLVCNGDTFVEFDLQQAMPLWERTRSPIVFALRVPDAERYGRIHIDENSEAHFIGRGHPGEGFISSGVCLTPRALFLSDDTPIPFSFEDFLFDSQRRGKIFAIEAGGRFIDIGIPEDYHAAQHLFQSR
ncbi:MAG: sugar phosphate nucleotidyltransferase [Pseudomonadota bacterium]